MTLLTAKESAPKIRKALKSDFPGTKFSVTVDASNFHDSVSIKWIDGPATKSVEESVKGFKDECYSDCYVKVMRTVSIDLYQKFETILENMSFTIFDFDRDFHMNKLKREFSI